MSGERRPVVRQEDLEQGFRALGLDWGDLVMVHSSLSAFGWVEAGAPTVLRAFFAVLGDEGTLVMPTLCQKDLERRFELWDIEHSPSDVGRITETLRLWPGARRSDHATHSVAAVGPLAEELTAGHTTAFGRPSPWTEAAFGFGSPWEKLYELDATYVFLGITFRYCTEFHFLQAELCRSLLEPVPERDRRRMADKLRGWQHEGLWPTFDFERMGERLEELGMVRAVIIGAARCLAASTRRMVDSAREELLANQEQWLPADFIAWMREAKALAR